MENNDGKRYSPRSSRNAWVGLVILCFGVLLLVRRLGLLIPGWVFTWPFALIVIGCIIGVRSGFRNLSSVGLILVGGLFLAKHEGVLPFGLSHYIWPLAIIVVGILIIIRPRRIYGWTNNNSMNWQHLGGAENMNDDIMDSVAIFYGIRRNILSQNFKGGEIVNIFGGTHINLTQAQVNGTANLDVVNIFGGIKMIVPADWDVRVNVVHIFAGTDDKRSAMPHPQSKNVLVLTGTTIFGGIDISSY